VAELFALLRSQLRPLVAEATVDLRFDAEPDLPTLRTDEGKLVQVLRNLVSNALKFTVEGEVRVRARLDQERGAVALVVADTGIGIAPSDRERIFEEFEQVHGPLQAGLRGTGLGLAVSQRLAGVLGGAISLASEPGVGSTFTLSIPVQYSAAPSSVSLRAGADGSSSAGVQAGGGKAAIVIDDDEMARYLAVHALVSLGFRVTEAADGKAGLDSVREQQPDLIVLDLRMPGLDGFDALDELKNAPETAAIPVVVQTGMTLSPAERDRLAPAVAILDKRADGSERLTAVVKQLLSVS
jgi:CheY-like chemotaxis protein/anti-sigma regulatory factor (Ser/Thr protein kinase)